MSLGELMTLEREGVNSLHTYYLRRVDRVAIPQSGILRGLGVYRLAGST